MVLHFRFVEPEAGLVVSSCRVGSAVGSAQRDEEMKGFDPCLSKDEWCCVTIINEQMGVLTEEKGPAAALDHLM